MFPLFDVELPDDIVIVNINPLVRDEIPKEPRDILNRINEISFNSSMLRELRAIAFVKRLITEGNANSSGMKNVLVHMIADDELMTDLGVATKTMPTPAIIRRLKEAGRIAAEEFLNSHSDAIGVKSSVDLSSMYE